MCVSISLYLTLSDNGDLEEVIELKRTQECVISESGLPKKITELFLQMYVMICSQIIKCAVDGKDLNRPFSTRGIFYERFKLHFVEMTIQNTKKIKISIIRSIEPASSADFCYFFYKLAI